MSHYVFCPILFSILLQFRDDPSPDPLIRIGLVHPSKEGLLLEPLAIESLQQADKHCQYDNAIVEIQLYGSLVHFVLLLLLV